jgi:hypothetical protein
MKRLCWKIAIVLLTFFMGTALAMLWITLNNNPVITVEAPPLTPEIEIPVPEIPGPPSEDEKSIKLSISKVKSPIRRIKGDGQFCEKYLLKKIAKEKSASSRSLRLKNFNPNEETLSPGVREWIENVWKETLFAAEIRNKQQKALLLNATLRAATGLSSSLQNWHIEIDNFYSDEFWSFSDNPKLAFWDKEGLLNYYSVVYSEDFLSATSDRDYNKLTFKIERYKINLDGKAQLISEEQNIKCE